MTKKHFIALADMIKADRDCKGGVFNDASLIALSRFCQEQNPMFNRERWLSYIAGECGSNGGNVKKLVNA